MVSANKILTVLHHSEVEARQDMLRIVRDKRAIDGKTTAYICEKGVCGLPISDFEKFKNELRKIHG